MPAQYVGPRTFSDGLAPDDADRTMRDGAKVVSSVHGTHLEAAIRKRVYTGVSATGGIALIAPAAGGGHPTLWNPSDSGRYASVIRLELGYISGANAPGCLEWGITINTGASIATGAVIPTFTQVAPVGVIGGGLDNKCKWSPTTNTFTAAPTYYRTIGFSLFTGLAATATTPFTLRADYDGDLVLAPGSALSLCAGVATTTALFQVAVTWEELDV